MIVPPDVQFEPAPYEGYLLPRQFTRMMTATAAIHIPSHIPQFDIAFTFEMSVAVRANSACKIYYKALILNAQVELNILAQTGTRCPNIIPFFGIARVSPFCPLPIALMERATDGDMYTFFSIQNGTAVQSLPDDVRFRAPFDILAGMQFLLSELSVLHWDLKLENVLVNNGRCQLCDFDHARTISKGLRVTWPASTLEMMTPEQVPPIIANFDPIACEIFTLGLVIMSILLTVPYVHLATIDENNECGATIEGIMEIHNAQQSPIPPSIRESTDATLLGFLDKICHPIPSQRFLSFDDVVAELDLLKPAIRVSRYVEFPIMAKK
jgi:serine/threonine protein kinase